MKDKIEMIIELHWWKRIGYNVPEFSRSMPKQELYEIYKPVAEEVLERRYDRLSREYDERQEG